MLTAPGTEYALCGPNTPSWAIVAMLPFWVSMWPLGGVKPPVDMVYVVIPFLAYQANKPQFLHLDKNLCPG